MTNEFVEVVPKSEWAKKIVAERGNVLKVIKVGMSAVMVGNGDIHSFTWAAWIENGEADFIVKGSVRDILRNS